jgi:hypothetical protein
MIFCVNCIDSLECRKVKAELPEGVTVIKDKNNHMFYVSTALSWEALIEWGKKWGLVIGVVNGGINSI